MDIKKIAFELKTGNAETITGLLKQLFESQTDCSSKTLFEVLYDLKFHRDLGVVFWAKKVMAKVEVNYQIRGPDPINQASEGDPDQPIEEHLPEPTREELLARMNSDPETITVDDLKKVCETVDDALRDILLALLTANPDPTVLSFITKQLGLDFPSEEMLLRLAPYLRHEDSRVVANTVEGIAAIKSPKAFVFLTQMLNHADNRVRSNVAVAIGQHDRDEAMTVVEKMLRLVGKEHMQISALHAVKVLGEARLFPVVIELLGDPCLFREVLNVFEAVPCAEAIQTLEAVLEQIPEDETKQEIQASIANIRQAMEDAANPKPKKRFAAWM